jgi:DeoR family fructose operon transcriptional repressor
LFVEERHAKLVDFLHQHKKATVHELEEVFNVSSATIRNDLRTLERQGLVTRTHGGAIDRLKSRFEQSLKERRNQYVHEKSQVAHLALSLINDGDAIILDSGTTVFELARLLYTRKGLTIITNDFDIAHELSGNENNTLIFIGGVVRKQFKCTAGALTEHCMSGLLVDKAFMGANNFDVNLGSSTPDIDQATTKKIMLQIASQKILLCTADKFGTQSFAQFARPEEFDILITNAIAPGEKEIMEQAGVEVMLPKRPDQ